jgi:hypothetical protein
MIKYLKSAFAFACLLPLCPQRPSKGPLRYALGDFCLCLLPSAGWPYTAGRAVCPACTRPIRPAAVAKSKGCKEKVRPFCLPCLCVGRLLPLQAKQKCAPFAFALPFAFASFAFALRSQKQRCVVKSKGTVTSKGRHQLRCLPCLCVGRLLGIRPAFAFGYATFAFGYRA